MLNNEKYTGCQTGLLGTIRKTILKIGFSMATAKQTCSNQQREQSERNKNYWEWVEQHAIYYKMSSATWLNNDGHLMCKQLVASAVGLFSGTRLGLWNLQTLSRSSWSSWMRIPSIGAIHWWATQRVSAEWGSLVAQLWETALWAVECLATIGTETAIWHCPKHQWLQ